MVPTLVDTIFFYKTLISLGVIYFISFSIERFMEAISF